MVHWLQRNKYLKHFYPGGKILSCVGGNLEFSIHKNNLLMSHKKKSQILKRSIKETLLKSFFPFNPVVSEKKILKVIWFCQQ
jgi:hypothetical protein